VNGLGPPNPPFPVPVRYRPVGRVTGGPRYRLPLPAGYVTGPVTVQRYLLPDSSGTSVTGTGLLPGCFPPSITGVFSPFPLPLTGMDNRVRGSEFRLGTNGYIPKLIEKSTTGGSRPSGGGVAS